MSFASMHNDYLDPDRHGNVEDFGHSEMLGALKAHNRGKWRWDVIDCSWTGKDADLENGHQGLHFDGIDEEHAYATVHALKTFPGQNVSLNIPKNATEEETGRAIEMYMEQAQEIMCGCTGSNIHGEWTGDDWCFSFSTSVKALCVLSDDETETDFGATAKSLIETAMRSLKGWEQEIGLADELIDQLAGWRDGRGRKMKEGQIPKCSVWAMTVEKQWQHDHFKSLINPFSKTKTK